MEQKRATRGFTLVELLVVMAIVAVLLTLAAPRYMGNIQKSKEAVLRENLATTREALDRFYADTGRYPETLRDLVANKYLRKLPLDPITERDNSWVVLPPPDPEAGGVYDIRSGSSEKASDGSSYNQW